MYRLIPSKPVAIGLLFSTLAVILLLVLGITTVEFADANLTFGLLGGLSAVLLASQNYASYSRRRNAQACNGALPTKTFQSRYLTETLLDIGCLAYALFVSLFISGNTITLGLPAIWLLLFLNGSALAELVV